jgi:serine protease Do
MMKQFLTTAMSLLLLTSGSVALGQDFSQLFKQTDPAVVVIMTQEKTPVRTRAGGVRQTKARGIGTGIIINSEGLILTAAHVVGSADSIEVMLKDERKRSARVLVSIGTADLALIQIEDAPQDLPFIPLGDSSKIDIGERVFVIGTPYGLEHTLTVGYLSGRRTMENTPFGDIEFLQTDAAINKGNSGGPMFSAQGELIGIVSHIKSQSGGSEGLGFAASSNMAKSLLVENPPVWLGADFVLLNEELASAFNAGQKHGMLVQKVTAGSIADRLGINAGIIPTKLGGADILLGGDIILAINGTQVLGTEQGMRQLIRDFRRVHSGDKLVIRVMRRGAEVELSATVD